MIDKEIANLKAMAISLSNSIETMLTKTITGIKKNDKLLLETVIYEDEDKINKKEVKIDKACARFFALFHSEAKNLRIAFVVSKLASDLERIGDRCVKIAESAIFLINNQYLIKDKDIETIMNDTSTMLKESITAFIEEDVKKAFNICKKDSNIDTLNKKIFENIVTYLQKECKNSEKLLHLLRITNEFEKIADLTTNISEGTVFISSGKIIKHNRYKKYDDFLQDDED